MGCNQHSGSHIVIWQENDKTKSVNQSYSCVFNRQVATIKSIYLQKFSLKKQTQGFNF